MVLEIRQAGQSDRDAVARLLDEAFRTDPVSSWVFPDPEHRAAVHGKFLGVFVDVALAEGRIDYAVDGSAAALWLRIPEGEPEGRTRSRRGCARWPTRTTSGASWSAG